MSQVYINITSTFIYVKGVLISILSLKDTECLFFSSSPAGFLCCFSGLDCLLTGGLAVLLCAAWWFWYWHSTTWACCAAPWATTSTPHRQHEAASQTRGERCWLRESSAWIQTVKERIDLWTICLCWCSPNDDAHLRLRIWIHSDQTGIDSILDSKLFSLRSHLA